MRVLAVALLCGVASLARAEVVMMLDPAAPCEPGGIQVWTPMMQAVADRVLGGGSGRKLEKIDPPNTVLQRLAGFQWNESATLPQGGWFVEAGPSTTELAAKATLRWRELAGEDAEPFRAAGGEGAMAAFAGIRRDFAFRFAFFEAKQRMLSWGTAKEPVRFFGVRGKDAGNYASSVRVLRYQPDDRAYALQFAAKEGDETLVLYQPAAPSSMLKAIESIVAWRGESGSVAAGGEEASALHDQDDLRVPLIQLQARRDFVKELEGLLYFQGDGVPWRIVQAVSSIGLNVDEKGVKFQARAEMAVDPFGSAPVQKPRWFWFDRPFFLFLWRDGAELPFAGVWFGSTEGFRR